LSSQAQANIDLRIWQTCMSWPPDGAGFI